MSETKGEMFAGLTVAIITPFKDGEVDETALRNLVDWHAEQGTHCLAPVGTTGESPTLSHAEHERVVEIVCEQAAGKIKVMAGAGSNSTKEAVRLSKHAKAAGADGVLIVAPYYNKPTQEGFYQHYISIADAADLPVVVYNIPGRSAKNIEPETIVRMAEHPQIVAVKEATGSMDQASSIIADCNLTVLSGDDSLTLPLMALGGKGSVSVVGNIVPKDVIAMIDAFNAGNLAEAQERHYRLFRMCRSLLGLSTNPIPIKAAMKLLGRDTGDLRLPMTPLSSEQESQLKQTLTDYGLL
ncbi:MAG: 4-hydroxy-tetrahydrodipicolinate synthase [Planctomycetaceae bacterium]|jgi:4-hydroxy-tetrahydrodipicolinate synthase|nr:4-hydroxy-tetrahydrodipicolinate synthase [Planctomycetaceae bacterium]